MHEKQNRQDEIMDFLRVLDTKLTMSLSDTEEIKETLTQLKFDIESMQELLTVTLEERMEEKNKKRWKREVL
jgi:NTP pyrophosphatase (non-canonical NTP hydrolase)